MQSNRFGLLQALQKLVSSRQHQWLARCICMAKRGRAYGGGGGRGAGAGGSGALGHTGPGGAGGAPRAGRKHETAPAAVTQPLATSDAECTWHRPPPPVLFLKKTLAAQKGFPLPPPLALHKQQHSSWDAAGTTSTQRCGPAVVL